jgi:fatty acid-binding protein DegV
VNRLLERAELFIIMNTLSYLRKSGRISTAKAAAGAALNMNPVVGFRDGSLDVMARPAGGRRARRFVEARLAALGPPTRALAMYTSSVDDAMAWRGFVQDRLGAPRFDVCPLSPVVGSTCGPGAHGLAVLWGADGHDGAAG